MIETYCVDIMDTREGGFPKTESEGGCVEDLQESRLFAVHPSTKPDMKAAEEEDLVDKNHIVKDEFDEKTAGFSPETIAPAVPESDLRSQTKSETLPESISHYKDNRPERFTHSEDDDESLYIETYQEYLNSNLLPKRVGANPPPGARITTVKHIILTGAPKNNGEFPTGTVPVPRLEKSHPHSHLGAHGRVDLRYKRENQPPAVPAMYDDGSEDPMHAAHRKVAIPANPLQLSNLRSGDQLGGPISRTARNGACEITKEELSSCFHLPSEAACRQLGIGLTVLKRQCRKFGIKRWPFRKLKSLDRLICNVQAGVSPGDQNRSLVKSVEELEKQKRMMESCMSLDLDDETKRLQQAFSKANHKARRAAGIAQTIAPRPPRRKMLTDGSSGPGESETLALPAPPTNSDRPVTKQRSPSYRDGSMNGGNRPGVTVSVAPDRPQLQDLFRPEYRSRDSYDDKNRSRSRSPNHDQPSEKSHEDMEGEDRPGEERERTSTDEMGRAKRARRPNARFLEDEGVPKPSVRTKVPTSHHLQSNNSNNSSNNAPSSSSNPQSSIDPASLGGGPDSLLMLANLVDDFSILSPPPKPSQPRSPTAPKSPSSTSPFPKSRVTGKRSNFGLRRGSQPLSQPQRGPTGKSGPGCSSCMLCGKKFNDTWLMSRFRNRDSSGTGAPSKDSNSTISLNTNGNKRSRLSAPADLSATRFGILKVDGKSDESGARAPVKRVLTVDVESFNKESPRSGVASQGGDEANKGVQRYMFLPCQHARTCQSCALKVVNSSNPACSACGKQVHKQVLPFRPDLPM